MPDAGGDDVRGPVRLKPAAPEELRARWAATYAQLEWAALDAPYLPHDPCRPQGKTGGRRAATWGTAPDSGHDAVTGRGGILGRAGLAGQLRRRSEAPGPRESPDQARAGRTGCVRYGCESWCCAGLMAGQRRCLGEDRDGRLGSSGKPRAVSA